MKIEEKKENFEHKSTRKIAGSGGGNLCFYKYKITSYKYSVFFQFKVNVSRKVVELLIELCYKKEGWV